MTHSNDIIVQYINNLTPTQKITGQHQSLVFAISTFKSKIPTTII